MKSTASFERRINQDSDERKLERGQYRSARNARVGTSQQNNVGALESAASNAILTGSYTFPAGTNRCIGTCADIKNNAIIYCFYNSNNNHRILRWDADTGVITDILDTDWNVAILGWTATTRLWNIRIVESGTDQLMFFHAVQGIPMRINLGIIAQRTTGAYTLTIDDISVAKKPPITAPTLAYVLDSGAPSSFIQNKFFQFRYRYIYENNEQSSWSPWSNLSIPPQDGVLYNKIVVTFNSGVKGVTKVEVARREGNGSSDTGTVNPTLYIFKTWLKGVNSDNTNYTVDFLNTEVLTPVSVVSSSKLFDSVPQLVGSQEVVQSNQIIYGDITEGYDNITNENIALNLDYERTYIGEFTTADWAGNYLILVGDWESPAVGGRVFIQINGSIVSFVVTDNSDSAVGAGIVGLLEQFGLTASYLPGVIATNLPSNDYFMKAYWFPETFSNSGQIAYYTKTNASQNIIGGYTKIEWNNVLVNGIEKLNITDFKLTNDCNGGSVTIVVSLTLHFSASAAFNLVLLDVTANTPIFFKQYTIGAPITQSITEIFDIESNSLIGKTIAIALEKTSGAIFGTTGTSHYLKIELKKYGDLIGQGFKSGSTHSFGIVYFDQYMRQGGVQAITDLYVPFPTQRSYGEYFNTENVASELGYIPQVDWEIKHLPPSWAYYYTWVYDGGSVQNYAQIVGVVSDVSTDVSVTTIKINPDNFSLYKFIYSGFGVGDRVRILGGPLNWDNGLNDTTLCGMEDTYIEGTIEGFSSTEITISTQSSNINVAILNRFLIEIYSITKSELFFEQNIYGIGNPTLSNRYHEGPNQNQNPSDPIATPAKGDFIGNVYFRLVSNYVNDTDMFTFLTESNSLSYQVESNYWNKGRPQIETPDQKQMRLNPAYRWSNQLIQNTQVNGMSSFDSGNIGVLSAKFGGLTGMREVGYTLKMIQESNYNTAFIGRKELQNADGSTNLVVTDNLIGSVNPSEDLYGTKYPGSIVINGRNLYWLDTIKGKVIRESGNQPFPISDYGMIKYWRDASLTIDGLGYDVFAGFDKQTEQLFITYRRTGADVFTLSFYDPERDGIEKGWVSFHDFTKVISLATTPIDIYGWVGQVFTSALGNGLYKHNASGSYLQLYGEQKTMKATSSFMLNPDQVTVFLAHWVRANQNVSGTIFTIQATAQAPIGMRSLLVPGNYSVRESVYYSAIKRDGYTKGFVADDSAAFINQMGVGRNMRGHVMLAEISYSGSTIFVLFSHSVADDYSPLS